MNFQYLQIPFVGLLFLAISAGAEENIAVDCDKIQPKGNCKCKVLWPSGASCPETSCLGGPADEKIICKSRNGCTIISGAGNDIVIGSTKSDIICTGSGNDLVRSGTNSINDGDYVDAGSGQDTVRQ